jgi:hypothetical protein
MHSGDRGTRQGEVPATITESEYYPLFTRLITGPTLVCLLVLGSSVWSIFRGMGTINGPILLALSVFSIIAMIVYAGVMPPHVVRGGGRGWLPFFAVTGLWVPYGLGCLLCFYKGAWSLWLLTKGFKIWSMVVALFWLIAGYQIVRRLDEMTEAVNAVSHGRLRVTRDIEGSG